MNRTTKELFLSIFLGFILPGWMLSMGVTNKEAGTPPPEAKPSHTMPHEVSHLSMRLLLPEAEVKEMNMDSYLVGVVLAEMPASFEMEALKAQAVVARTYTLKCIQSGAKHDGAVCTDSACCQAYIIPEQYTGGEENLEKIRSAVLDTSDLVLTYGDHLIEATYFSCSGGVTEDAVAVWGMDYPYLRSVESPGEEAATHYTDTVTFSAEGFQQSLGQTLSGKPENWFGFTTYTAGGGVNTMRIGGVDYKGTELRSMLGLRSTVFSVQVLEGNIVITTKGYGHRVGMSQYGADAMAVSGCTYDEILAHYYPGTALTLFND